jgi:hypothetical protein
MHGLIRLGWSHFAIVCSGVAMVLLVCWMALMPTLQELYITEFALPRIAERYGFEFGTVTLSRDNVRYELPGFVSVNPAGEIARMGVRQRDVLFDHHGQGATVLYSALMALERGHAAEFKVVNADDWSTGRERDAFRTIQVPGRDAP